MIDCREGLIIWPFLIAAYYVKPILNLRAICLSHATLLPGSGRLFSSCCWSTTLPNEINSLLIFSFDILFPRIKVLFGCTLFRHLEWKEKPYFQGKESSLESSLNELSLLCVSTNVLHFIVLTVSLHFCPIRDPFCNSIGFGFFLSFKFHTSMKFVIYIINQPVFIRFACLKILTHYLHLWNHCHICRYLDGYARFYRQSIVLGFHSNPGKVHLLFVCNPIHVAQFLESQNNWVSKSFSNLI